MKLKFRATPKDMAAFVAFSVVLLYFVAILVLNIGSIARDGEIYGFNPIPAFMGENLPKTMIAFLLILIVIIMGVSGTIFNREKGIGFEVKDKSDKGYSRWAKEKEMKKELKMILPNAENSPYGGIPIINNGKEIWVDDGEYHNLIIGILELLLYPNLSSPKKETPIHEGRKRIDITFHNSAETGFFYTLPSKNPLLPCQFIFVECKNYTGEVANPELDQLSGRFSPRKGKVGILACRNLDENDTFLKRCADTYEDERGLIIPITDEDLVKALRQFCQKGAAAIEEILSNKYEQICFMK